MKVSITDVISTLEKMYQDFNNHFYNGELLTPVITVSPDEGRGALGWFTTWKAWQVEGQEEGYYEINICADYLNRDIVEIVGTLLHEMAHLYASQNGIKDTSRNGRYHNAKFKEIAEQHGLHVEKDSKYGWTITTLSSDTIEYMKTMDVEKFVLYRTEMVKAESTRKKSSSRKYVCPYCGTIVRATKYVRIVCMDCDSMMEVEE